MRALKLLAAAALLIGIGCSHGELLRRYRSDLGDEKADRDHVRVNAFVSNVPPKTASDGVTKLSDRGQKALVGIVGGMSKSPDALYGNLGRPFGSRKAPAVIDRSHFKKRIVISALRDFDNMRNPADRIHELQTVITLTDRPQGTRFDSWSRFTTEEENIDLGKLSLKKSSATKVGLSSPIPGTPASGTLEQSFTREQGEELTLGLRRVKLVGALEDGSATLYQQGVRNVDLTGTFALDVSVVVDAVDNGDVVMQLAGFKKDGRWVDPKELQFEPVRLKVPNTCGGDLKFVLSGRYRARLVTCNDRTYSEGDDGVRFVDGNVDAGPYTLISARELEVVVWRILDPRGLALGLEGVGELTLSSFGAAVDLLDYLDAVKPEKLRGRRLGFMDLRFDPLDAGQIGDLQVESLSINQCTRALADSGPVTSVDAFQALVAAGQTPLTGVSAEDIDSFLQGLRFTDGKLCAARYGMLEDDLDEDQMKALWSLFGPEAAKATRDAYCPRIGFGCKVQPSSLCNVAYCGGPVP